MADSILNTQIHADMVAALKAGRADELSVIRMLISAINNAQIDKQDQGLTDEDIVSIIQKQVKQRNEAIGLYQQGGREELAAKERAEVEILSRYLPQQISADEINKAVADIISKMPDQDKNNFGLVMRAVMAELKGKADGSVVSEAVKSVLSKES